MSDPVDGEFVEATVVQPVAWRCHCPACRVMIDEGNYCDWCIQSCVPLLRKSHAARGPVLQGMADGRSIVEGVKAGARALEGLASIADAVRGRPRRRRPR